MRPRFASAALAALAVLAAAPAAARPPVASDYRYVAAWRGVRPGGGIGLGTAVLIAPSWVVTAKHVASPKASSPGRKVTLKILGGISVAVTRAYLAPKGDLALARLARPIRSVPHVALLDRPLVSADGKITFTMAGSRGGVHFHVGRTGTGGGLSFRHDADPGGGRPGKPGDSGGAFVLDRPGSARDVLFAVIHGGGRGDQPAAVRAWIDKTMAPSGERARWVPAPRRRSDVSHWLPLLRPFFESDAAFAAWRAAGGLARVVGDGAEALFADFLAETPAAGFASGAARARVVSAMRGIVAAIRAVERQTRDQRAGFAILAAIARVEALAARAGGSAKDDWVATASARRGLASRLDLLRDWLDDWLD